MLEVGRTYQRIYPDAFNRGWLREVIIREKRIGGYFVGSDWNHYDPMGRRGAYGIIDPSDTLCRKFDLIVTGEMSLEEMLKECLN
jgi:hypothetical protein